MADDKDESLAHVGFAIYALLEQIAYSVTKLSGDSEALQTLNLVINDGDRFKIWSSSIGLLIPGHGSLDYRVRGAESLSKTFRSFLTDLRENFEEVLTLGLQDTPAAQTKDGAADDNSEGDDDSNIMNTLLESIKDIIDRLFRLATKLRSPETRLRSSRAQAYQKLDDGVDLFKYFGEFERDFVSSLFRHYRKGPKLVNSAEHMASPDGDSKFHVDDEASKYLIERIALANVARRRQFAYWKHHRLKLEKHTEAAIAARKVPELIKVTSILPATVNLVPIYPAPAMTISTATQLLHPIRDFDDLASMASVSEYMPSSIGEHSDVVIFPPPPHVAADSKFFECPYCFTTCAKKTSNVKAWRAHLIHDLRPYICTYKGCRTPDQLYDTKIDWIQHENTSHATTWQCPLHPSEVLDDIVAFQLHAADGHTHSAPIKGSVQEAVVAEPMNKTGRSCPICTMSGLPVAQLNDHVAVHLERLAIFSLPKHTSTAEADDDGQGSDEANGEEDSRGLDMESDLSFGSAPISMLGENLPLEEHARPQSPLASEGVEQMYKLELELAKCEKEFGPEHTLTLNAANNIGALYRDQGKLAEAEKMYTRALAGLKKVLGPDHPSTIQTIRILGLLYQGQGRLEDAERMLRVVVENRLRILGKEHPDTLISMSNLASVLHDQGKQTEAEQMFRVVVERSERILGKEHLDTLTSMSNLALVLSYQGKYTEAEQMYRVVVENRKRILGEEHPYTLASMSNLALVLHGQGKLTEAEQMYRVAVENQKKNLGEEHRYTLASMSNLASVLQDQGKLTEAEQMYRVAVKNQKRILGKEHPDTLTSMTNLALVLSNQSKYTEAQRLMEQAVQMRISTLGEEHSVTLQSKTLLADLLKESNKGNKGPLKV